MASVKVTAPVSRLLTVASRSQRSLRPASVFSHVTRCLLRSALVAIVTSVTLAWSSISLRERRFLPPWFAITRCHFRRSRLQTSAVDSRPQSWRSSPLAGRPRSRCRSGACADEAVDDIVMPGPSAGTGDRVHRERPMSPGGHLGFEFPRRMRCRHSDAALEKRYFDRDLRELPVSSASPRVLAVLSVRPRVRPADPRRTLSATRLSTGARSV